MIKPKLAFYTITKRFISLKVNHISELKPIEKLEVEVTPIVPNQINEPSISPSVFHESNNVNKQLKDSSDLITKRLEEFSNTCKELDNKAKETLKQLDERLIITPSETLIEPMKFKSAKRLIEDPNSTFFTPEANKEKHRLQDNINDSKTIAENIVDSTTQTPTVIPNTLIQNQLRLADTATATIVELARGAENVLGSLYEQHIEANNAWEVQRQRLVTFVNNLPSPLRVAGYAAALSTVGYFSYWMLVNRQIPVRSIIDGARNLLGNVPTGLPTPPGPVTNVIFNTPMPSPSTFNWVPPSMPGASSIPAVVETFGGGFWGGLIIGGIGIALSLLRKTK